MLHQTFTKVGYRNLISEAEWNSKGIWYIDSNKSPKQLIDSLELTYPLYNEAPKYYKEFWQRRTDEQNDEIVYKVVRDIKQAMDGNPLIHVEQKP